LSTLSERLHCLAFKNLITDGPQRHREEQEKKTEKQKPRTKAPDKTKTGMSWIERIDRILINSKQLFFIL